MFKILLKMDFLKWHKSVNGLTEHIQSQRCESDLAKTRRNELHKK